MLPVRALVVALTVGLGGPLFADLLVVTESGTFVDSNTPITSVSAPFETWSYSFTIDRNPSVSNVSPNVGFDAAFSNFTYSLNGLSVSVTPADIRFFTTSAGGLLDIDFVANPHPDTVPVTGFQIGDPAVFSGPTDAPTFAPNVYQPASITFFSTDSTGAVTVSDAKGNEPDLIRIQSVPEPSPILVLTIVFAVLTINCRQNGRLARRDLLRPKPGINLPHGGE
jgi:hypothetical protein